jgi:hypothetical protein
MNLNGLKGVKGFFAGWVVTVVIALPLGLLLGLVDQGIRWPGQSASFKGDYGRITFPENTSKEEMLETMDASRVLYAKFMVMLPRAKEAGAVEDVAYIEKRLIELKSKFKSIDEVEVSRCWISPSTLLDCERYPPDVSTFTLITTMGAFWVYPILRVILASFMLVFGRKE